MKKLLLIILLLASSPTSGRVVDHRHTNLDIDISSVIAARDSIKWYYIRLSHGRQLNVGLERLETDTFSVCLTYDYLCEDTSALCAYNKLTSPYDFWNEGGADIVRGTLETEPRINLFMFCWCTHLNTFSAAEVDTYLTRMGELESEYPGVTFIYATGTAEEQGELGFNRYRRNMQIRKFCAEHYKPLYDFADIECWYNDTLATYTFGQWEVPYLHPSLYGNDAEHASFLNCEYKAMAFWHLLAEQVAVTGGTPPPSGGKFSLAYPNPFNPSLTIAFTLENRQEVSLLIFDASGHLVRKLLEGRLEAGTFHEQWDGRDRTGRPVASGVYFYHLRAGLRMDSSKVILLR
ncbi:MAG: T9SS type A sorting domain-containing protein [Candidatus Krumholzibacteriota bacterium]|nr:T9SS type A sorting domain-containing protein [Candidatus Krumholzibacteriota bacterium]